ncbi:single-stranded DNA-binding protein [Nocardioides sp. W3-2-3]|nr:single-stranded DNA-binding protein [Nocardioides convexus]
MSFPVMVNRRVPDGEGWKDATPTTHYCEKFGPEAENIAESLTKGTRVVVHGSLYTETWQDRETNQPRYAARVRVEEIGVSLKWATVSGIERSVRSSGTSTQGTDQGQDEPPF